MNKVFKRARAAVVTPSTCTRRIFATSVALATFSLVTTRSYGHGVSQGALFLDHPYAVPSLAGVNNGAAYLRGINNKGEQPDRLISASSPVAARVELHQMALEGDVMRMRQVPFVVLPAKAVTPLRHDGTFHLMLVDLKQPLKDGDRFDLTLNFEHAGSQTVKVWVQTPRVIPSDAHRH